MNRKPILLTLLLTSTVFSLGLQTSGKVKYLAVKRVIWGSVSDPAEISAGENEARLIIEIQSLYSHRIRGLTSKLWIIEPFYDVTGKTNEELISYGKLLNPGELTTIEYCLNIGSPAEGVYELNLTLEYELEVEDRPGRPPVWIEDSLETKILVRVRGKSFVRVETSERKLYEGKINNVYLRLYNLGDSPVYSLQVSAQISPQSLGEILTDLSSYKLSKLEKNDCFSIPFKIAVQENTGGKTVKIIVQVRYRDMYGVTRTKETYLGFLIESLIRKKPKVLVKSFKVGSTIQPGETFHVEIELTNEGDKTAKNVEVTLRFSSKEISFLDLNKKFIGSLPKHKTKAFSLKAYAEGNAKPGSHQCEIKIKYEDEEGERYEESSSFSFKVESFINVKLINQAIVEKEIFPGSTVTFQADVLVIGRDSAEFLEITMESPAIEGKPYLYVGSVAPDDPAPIEITFKVKDGVSTGKHNLSFKISYLDSCNKRHLATQDFSFQVIKKKMELEVESESEGVLSQLLRFLRKIIGLEP